MIAAADEFDPVPLTDQQSGLVRNWSDLACWAETCPTCAVVATPTPMPHGRWVLAVTHEQHCPAAAG